MTEGFDTFGDKPRCLSSGKESRKPEGLKNGGFVALSINTEYTPDKFRKQTPMLAIGVYECVDKYGICVDTHVHRISNRLGLVRTKNAFETELTLRKILSRHFWKEYNPILVAFGQNVCKPVSPFCSQCKISKYCKRIGVTISR